MTIWNSERGKPVKSGLPYRKAVRLASMLERMFNTPYMVINS